MNQTRHAKLLKNSVQTRSALGTRQETQQDAMQSQSSSRTRRTRAFTEQRQPDNATTARATHNAEHGHHLAFQQEIDKSVHR